MLIRRGRLPQAAAVVLAFFAIPAAFVGGLYVDQTYPEQVPLLGLHPEARGGIDHRQVDEALRIVEAHYFEPKLDYRMLTRGSVRGLVDSLNDPYSEYLDPNQFRMRQDFYAGRHVGMIGVYVSFKGDRPVIAGVLPASPAQRAGLQSEDVILRIEDRETRGLKAEETAALIRGPVGTPLKLTIQRGVAESDFHLTRADFKSPTVQSLMLENEVLYMRIYEFGEATEKELDDQLSKSLPRARSVVLDLRDNGGGFVGAATAAISRFLPDGEAFEVRKRDGSVQQTKVQGAHPGAGLPLLVLINGQTASAAEIVAGALQARGRARLIGSKSFGKGSIQVDYALPDGGDLHLTVEHWLLPDGRSVDKSGLVPDVAVALPAPAAAFDVAQPGRGYTADTQLNRALEILKAQ